MDHARIYHSLYNALQLSVDKLETNNTNGACVQIGIILESLRRLELKANDDDCEEESCPECIEEEIEQRKEIVNLLNGFKANLEDFAKFKENLRKK
jgi:hypothetical protein